MIVSLFLLVRKILLYGLVGMILHITSTIKFIEGYFYRNKDFSFTLNTRESNRDNSHIENTLFGISIYSHKSSDITDTQKI